MTCAELYNAVLGVLADIEDIRSDEPAALSLKKARIACRARRKSNMIWHLVNAAHKLGERQGREWEREGL